MLLNLKQHSPIQTLKQNAGCNTFDYLGALVLLSISICVRFNPGIGQDS